MDKPFLTSIGVSFPTFGIYGHRYVRSRKKYKLKSKKFLGLRITWSSYVKRRAN